LAIDVRTPFSNGTTLQIGQTGSSALLMGTGVVDSSLGTAGVYNFPLDTDWGATALQVLATVGGSPGAGAGFIIVEYLL
jgi:hypothetical protein